MFNYRVISIGDKSDFSNVTTPGVRIPDSPLHIPSSAWHQQQATLGKCTHIDKHQSSHRWEQKGIQFSHFPLFSRWVQFGVLCLQIFLSSPLVRPVLFSCPDVFVAVQNANTPVPWIDGAGRSPPLTPPQAPPPHLCTFAGVDSSYIQVAHLHFDLSSTPAPPPSPTLLILACHGFRYQPELITLTLIIGLISSPITYQMFENSFLLSLLINNLARYKFLGYSPSSLFRPLKILLQRLQNLRHIWYFTSWISFDFFPIRDQKSHFLLFLMFTLPPDVHYLLV